MHTWHRCSIRGTLSFSLLIATLRTDLQSSTCILGGICFFIGSWIELLLNYDGGGLRSLLERMDSFHTIDLLLRFCNLNLLVAQLSSNACNLRWSWGYLLIILTQVCWWCRNRCLTGTVRVFMIDKRWVSLWLLSHIQRLLVLTSNFIIIHTAVLLPYNHWCQRLLSNVLLWRLDLGYGHVWLRCKLATLRRRWIDVDTAWRSEYKVVLLRDKTVNLRSWMVVAVLSHNDYNY